MVPLGSKGKIIIVKFLDHSTFENAEPIECETMGKIVEVNSKAVTLEWWTILSGDNSMKESNRERTCVIQSTIFEYIELKPSRGKRY